MAPTVRTASSLLTLLLALALASAAPTAAQDMAIEDAAIEDTAAPDEGVDDAPPGDDAPLETAEGEGGPDDAPPDDELRVGTVGDEGDDAPEATPEDDAARAEIADLEDRVDAAEGRVSLFAALTIGGTTLMIGGVVAMVVVAAIPPMGCTPMVECVTPVEDFAAGMTLTIAGGAILIVGAILWGDADMTVRRLQGELEGRRRDLEPIASVTQDGFRLGLRGAF